LTSGSFCERNFYKGISFFDVFPAFFKATGLPFFASLFRIQKAIRSSVTTMMYDKVRKFLTSGPLAHRDVKNHPFPGARCIKDLQITAKGIDDDQF